MERVLKFVEDVKEVITMIFGRNKAMIITRALELIEEERLTQLNSKLTTNYTEKPMSYWY